MASVVNHTLSLDQAQNTPPPAAVTISSVQASTTAVFERLDPASARRRLAAAASSGQDGRLSGGGQAGESGVGALQRAVQAWAEEEQVPLLDIRWLGHLLALLVDRPLAGTFT
ncbi:hypothetical protein HaLaN_01313 [Haematococcus lacustris]|uniref:Uncharacterized protein n=1 Tax=Haematococcus lacustris TaxID=44745 RepID=A0A699Y900_HAELA|nr:hypothetical protein HaLaN_01313 [Haematococcus lacustris]